MYFINFRGVENQLPTDITQNNYIQNIDPNIVIRILLSEYSIVIRICEWELIITVRGTLYILMLSVSSLELSITKEYIY